MATLDELLAEVRQHEVKFEDDIAQASERGGTTTSARLAALKSTYTSRKNGVVAGLMERLA